MSAQRPAARSSGRKHRLPKHLNLDYILIPAPDDLSLLTVTEKSPLPAIIVTPSSPSSTKDFSIAFLATPKKPTLRERLLSRFCPSSGYTKLPSSPEMAAAFPASPPVSTSSSCAWRDRWRNWTGGQAAIALPITSPSTENAPGSWYADPPAKRRNLRFFIFPLLVFLLVFVHVFTHYLGSTSASSIHHSGHSRSGMVMPQGVVVDNNETFGSVVGHGHGHGAGAKVHWHGWLNGAHKKHGSGSSSGSGAAFVPDEPINLVVPAKADKGVRSEV